MTVIEKADKKSINDGALTFRRAFQENLCPVCLSGRLEMKQFLGGKVHGHKYVGCTTFPSCRHFEWCH